MGAVKPKFTSSLFFFFLRSSILAWNGGEDKAFNARGEKGPLATRRSNFVGLPGTNF